MAEVESNKTIEFDVVQGRFPSVRIRTTSPDAPMHRETLHPDSDLSGHVLEVREAAQAVFTDEVKAAYAEAQGEFKALILPDPIDGIQNEMSRRLNALASGYAPEERETWATQVKEAEAIKAGATTAAMLAPLAGVKGRTLDEQADRVLLLAAQFAAASGAIMAARDALLALDPMPADYTNDSHWT